MFGLARHKLACFTGQRSILTFKAQRAIGIPSRINSSGFATNAMQTERHVQHILLPVEERENAETLQESISKGQDFAKLAKEHSLCPSAQQGGELGWVKTGMGLPSILEDAIFEADIGEVGTAETHLGAHIFRVTEERQKAGIQDMSPEKLKSLLEGIEADIQFIDVREEMEHRIASLPKFQLLPLSRMGEWAPSISSTFDTEKKTVCLCHHGVRSMRMASFLASEGFKDVHNVTGGIDAYSHRADRNVPQY